MVPAWESTSNHDPNVKLTALLLQGQREARSDGERVAAWWLVLFVLLRLVRFS